MFLALITFCLQLHAQSGFTSKSVGHLVTSNNGVLKAQEVGVGTLYAAYGVTDSWTFGTSPFAFFNFDMYNAQSRWAWKVSETEKAGIELDYYKTFRDNQPGDFESDAMYYSFKMEAWDVKMTYTRLVEPEYRLSISGSYYYYIDDDRPFSLRMDPVNGDPFAMNLTSLHEIKLTRDVYFSFEAGFWGMNYTYPYLHMGGSLAFQGESFLAAAGVSSTFSPWFPIEKAKWFAGYDSRASFHPELQLQAFF